jgi:exopolysaccharide biosynthesis polyprenyl glycosylphosphotransferase
MLLDCGDLLPSEANSKIVTQIISALSGSTRATDIIGWYKNDSVIGVLFSEIIIDNRGSMIDAMMARMSSAFSKTLSLTQLNQVSVSFHVFPETWDSNMRHRPSNPKLYPDLSAYENRRKFSRAVKRLVDIAGSIIGLVLFAPIFAVLALAIKLTSKGPVFYCQERIGKHGKPFTFIKFRSMYVDNDSAVHQEYVRQLIAGKAEATSSNGDGDGVYKITADSRITKVGNFLRRSSLDELPQFINVLGGEMSLVGPRPPLPYEVEAYDIWHRARLLEAKPGITGLWQVNGRSRVKFDEMVRLDIRYARTWSIWLDIKILLRTPHAVLIGEGAY